MAAPERAEVVAAKQPGRSAAVNWVKREFGPTWRFGFNLGPTIAHLRRPRRLGAEGQRVLRELRRNGVAFTSIEAMTGSNELFDRCSERVEGMIDDHAAELDELRRANDPDGYGEASPDKPFLIELMGDEPEIDPADPLFQLAMHDQLRGVAEAYNRMTVQLRDLNAWINIRTSGDAFSSQRWHRDLPEDHAIVKAFIYLRDIDEGTGPTEFIPRTHRGSGKRVELDQEHDGLQFRVHDHAVDERFPPESRVVATGKAGTIVFLDTRGFHRGGRAVTSDRVVVQALYSSRSSIRHAVLRPAPGVDASSLAADVALVRR